MKLKPGEVICPDCNGTGQSNEKDRSTITLIGCDKCLGAGKLDWVEVVVGKRPKYMTIEWPSADELYGPKINDEYVKNLSDQIAKQIDEEILKSLGVPPDEL